MAEMERTGQAEGRGRQRGAEKIILRIPVSKITAEKHRENRARIIRREIARDTHAAGSVETASARAVRPQVTL